MPASAAPDPPEVLLRVGARALPLSGALAPGFAAAVEDANRRARLDGLPDNLNPSIIDPAKAERFVAGLAAQPGDTLARMAGHELRLGWAGLGLGAAAPTRPEAFAAPFTLVIDSVRGRHVHAHTTVPVDPALARTRAGEAEAALRSAEESVRALEAAGRGGDALGQARRRRSLVALAWRTNAAAWAGAAPGDEAARTALAAAQTAVRAYEMPSSALP